MDVAGTPLKVLMSEVSEFTKLIFQTQVSKFIMPKFSISDWFQKVNFTELSLWIAWLITKSMNLTFVKMVFILCKIFSQIEPFKKYFWRISIHLLSEPKSSRWRVYVKRRLHAAPMEWNCSNRSWVVWSCRSPSEFYTQNCRVIKEQLMPAN